MAYASVTELSLKGCLDDIIGVMACMNASKTAEVDIAQDRINQLYMNSLVFNWIGNSRDVKEKDLETGESQLVSERRIGGKKLEISAFLYDELNPQGVYNRLDTRDAELESLGKGYVHMICLDEGHLPDPKHFIPMVKKLRTYADKPRIVLVSLLDRDFKGQKYETAKFIESHGIVVSKSACCRAIKSDGTDCGLQARRTLRVVKREHGDGLNVPEFPFLNKKGERVYGKIPVSHTDPTQELEPTEDDESLVRRDIDYLPVCRPHHIVYGVDLVEDFHDFYVEKSGSAPFGKVAIADFLDAFKDVPQLHNILRWYTEEGGWMVNGDHIMLRPMHIHPTDGYVVAPSVRELRENQPETIYTANGRTDK